MKRRRISKGEKVLYTFGFLSVIMVIAFKIFGGASIGHYSMSIEKLNREISLQENQNESLVMQVNELTSFDNVRRVIEDMGLSYQNENIIVVNR